MDCGVNLPPRTVVTADGELMIKLLLCESANAPPK